MAHVLDTLELWTLEESEFDIVDNWLLIGLVNFVSFLHWQLVEIIKLTHNSNYNVMSSISYFTFNFSSGAPFVTALDVLAW